MRFIGILLAFIVLMMAGCTEQNRAKNWGGATTMNLPAGKKLVVATWKENSLWILTRDMRKGEVPESYEFKESSSWGVMQGTVTIKESL